MKQYLKTIQLIQAILIDISIVLLLVLPVVLSFFSDSISPDLNSNLYLISHISLFFVMIIRPLADIIKRTTVLRPLIMLRKGAGILSASIIVSFILSKIIISPLAYFSAFGSAEYWSLSNFSLLAHLGDISAIILLVTSNNLSKKILSTAWKKVQKLSYLYFYSSSIYVYLMYQDKLMIPMILVVTVLTLIAYIINQKRYNEN